MPAATGSKRVALIINVISHTLYILTLPLWYLVSMFSVMLFDAPGSEQRWGLWAVYYGLKGYPIIVLAAIALAWILYAKGRYNRTYLINVIPVVYILMCGGLLVSLD